MKKVFFAILCFYILFCSSCKMKASNSSFDLKLETVDIFLKQNNFSQAKDYLKKNKRYARTVFERLSFIRRFYILGMDNEVEKMLKATHKKFPLDVNVAAVYANHLAKKGHYLEAEKVASFLWDTPYKSIPAEINIVLNEDKKDISLVDSYKIAGNFTKNVQFFINAASLCALHGEMAEALAFHPNVISAYDNSLFWAKLSYDSGDWMRCIHDINAGEFSFEGEMLKADALVHLGEIEKASVVWSNLVNKDERRDANLLLNVAFSNYFAENRLETQRYLTQLVEQFPDFVNGLVFYGKFAYQSSKIKQPEDLLTLAVRKLGFRSIKMQEIDSMPLIPVSDALHRMDNFLDKYATSENKDKIQYYELMVERQKLLWLYENKYENSEKNIDMWYLLEKCTGNNEIYPEYLAKYATWLFIFSQRFEDAQNLLNTHLQNKSTKGNFDTMLLWEKEYEAFLQGKLHKNYEAAFEIYENLTTDKMSVQALQNYANICEAKFFYDKALRLYGMAQEKSNDSKEKSDIHYKIANVQIAKGSFDDAILSLNYSINLNPGNTKSRLILKKISK
ncbi:MAG: hypothetical protein GX220_02570 [Treponema sp.]|nr:hypothetical protein [Treponema sp.]